MDCKTILIASNDRLLSDSIAEVLDEGQFFSIYSEHATDVILKVLEVRLDLIILDIDLSGISGLEILPIIKKVRPKIPLVVVSSDNSFKLGQEIAKWGIWLFLLKPIETEKLRSFLSFVQMKSGEY